MHCTGIEIELIEEAEFMKQKKHFMPKIELSHKEDLIENYSVSTPKNVGNVSKKRRSAGYCKSSCPRSSSFAQRGDSF